MKRELGRGEPYTYEPSFCSKALEAAGLDVAPPQTLSMLSRSVSEAIAARHIAETQEWLLQREIRHRMQQRDNGGIGSRMREARINVGLSQYDLMYRTHIPQSVISCYERGKLGIPGARAEIISAALGIRTDDLLCGVRREEQIAS